MTGKDLIIQDLRREVETLKKEIEWKEKVIELAQRQVAPVVRCKDCIYWQDNNGGYPHEDCKWNSNETPDADDFCSCGERKVDSNDAR